MKKALQFVQRTRILLRCDNVVVAVPSLGVSSLDLGPLASQAASFLFREPLQPFTARRRLSLRKGFARQVSHLRDSITAIFQLGLMIPLFDLNQTRLGDIYCPCGFGRIALLGRFLPRLGAACIAGGLLSFWRRPRVYSAAALPLRCARSDASNAPSSPSTSVMSLATVSNRGRRSSVRSSM